jgi:hypothetical protein
MRPKKWLILYVGEDHGRKNFSTSYPNNFELLPETVVCNERWRLECIRAP